MHITKSNFNALVLYLLINYEDLFNLIVKQAIG
jgi:hypothetical protein